MVKDPPAVWETWVWTLGWEDPLEEGMTTLSSIFTWIPWTEEPGRPQSMGSQKVGHTTEWLSTAEGNHHVPRKVYICIRECGWVVIIMLFLSFFFLKTILKRHIYYLLSHLIFSTILWGCWGANVLILHLKSWASKEGRSWWKAFSRAGPRGLLCPPWGHGPCHPKLGWEHRPSLLSSLGELSELWLTEE